MCVCVCERERQRERERERERSTLLSKKCDLRAHAHAHTHTMISGYERTHTIMYEVTYNDLMKLFILWLKIIPWFVYIINVCLLIDVNKIYDIPQLSLICKVIYISYCVKYGARCSSVVRAFAHGAMGRQIDPSWSEPIELFPVKASAPRLM